MRLGRIGAQFRATAVVVVVCLALASSGCGSKTAEPQRSPTPSVYAMTHPQIIPTKSGHPDALYVPNPIRVHVGQPITWTNRDTDPHNVEEVDGLFGSPDMPYTGTYTWVPTQPGTYHYICTLHTDMHGEIIVTR